MQSSKAKQQQFVSEVFHAWDNYKDHIKNVSFLNLTEWSAPEASGMGARYGECPGSNCNAFKEYLRTLGLRNYADGSSKDAFMTLIEEAKKRGF